MGVHEMFTEPLRVAREGSQAFWEGEALSAKEVSKALELLTNQHETTLESFTEVRRTPETEWLYEKMLSIAARADLEAGWGLLEGSSPCMVDHLIYDRFGPRFSAPEFKWHCDAQDTDPNRKVSVVVYFTSCE